ncbi:MAG: type 4a pilus biogenesis protein PilO [Candidatus Eisenbacteria bacterium]|uniref:Type 4a pilus biogenesis protein PilO n=1 Tax=Eiseniibacteriota bacterium TaxID=2212470 RepID=A0A7Y2H1S1_UNCEI|nr:type 4a pilus biogenesis protein PilO [Candidatus Eisenbacteria bacterium]
MDLQNPRTQKYVIVGILSAAALYVFFFSTFVPFGHRAYVDERQVLEADFQKLSADLSKARQTLSNRAEVERQYEVLNRRWEVAANLLPEEREVADLLRQVTLAGQQSGVEFLLFRPKPQIPGEVYVEAPVEVKVVGGYHEVGTFLSEVANLDRIVNVDNLRLDSHDDDDAPSETVTASFTATAYTLTDEVKPAGGEDESADAKTKGGQSNAG